MKISAPAATSMRGRGPLKGLLKAVEEAVEQAVEEVVEVTMEVAEEVVVLVDNKATMTATATDLTMASTKDTGTYQHYSVHEIRGTILPKHWNILLTHTSNQRSHQEVLCVQIWRESPWCKSR